MPTKRTQLPDLTDPTRCVGVHMELPVQCVLPRAHRENWHEAWHPQTLNRLRWQAVGCQTQELHHGAWHPTPRPPIGPITPDCERHLRDLVARGASGFPHSTIASVLAELDRVRGQLAATTAGSEARA